MPRTIDEIINQAEELVARFEAHEPDPDAVRDAAALRDIRQKCLGQDEAGQRVTEAVEKARVEGHSWDSIGAMLGTSSEAARQRYGRPARRK